jgi:hypothetical protein
MPGDRKNRNLLEAGGYSRHDVPVEVSSNEPIGADRDVAVGDRSLRVGTLEDIVAEKLRAYLQQKGEIRNRNRRQNLLDIAHILQTGAPLDLDSVSQYLLEKAWARDVPVSKAAFRDPELADCARREYDDLKATVREGFVPFEEALKSLFTLVEKLAIPAH